MPWLDALVDLLGGAAGVDGVLRVPPVSTGEIAANATVAVLMPAGRTSTRLGGGDRQQDWTQRVMVARRVPALSTAALSTAVDAVTAATLRIDDAMDLAVTLGGAAASVSPFVWDEGEAVELPAGAGHMHAAQSGTCTVTVIAPHRRQA